MLPLWGQVRHRIRAAGLGHRAGLCVSYLGGCDVIFVVHASFVARFSEPVEWKAESLAASMRQGQLHLLM